MYFLLLILLGALPLFDVGPTPNPSGCLVTSTSFVILGILISGIGALGLMTNLFIQTIRKDYFD
jgi:hypothetical protein